MLDGSGCRVRLPFEQLPKGLERITIVRHAKSDSVFAKRLKVLESIIYLSDESRKPHLKANQDVSNDFAVPCRSAEYVARRGIAA
ncbi:hypothetical protein [Anaeromyxobacter oryzae]|uniref:Uncharacterized protein n=1 Tax=Anaeromyxobacter oryzae TaxID=2918170 RepID=A0ABM7X1S7_9BACT|nr:hypothetical protein [Anaeromyxobacter oryzae]BDG05746.1 hypothetical protein AMOR_47420 [Anaeromyxobacter oryzae]